METRVLERVHKAHMAHTQLCTRVHTHAGVRRGRVRCAGGTHIATAATMVSFTSRLLGSALVLSALLGSPTAHGQTAPETPPPQTATEPRAAMTGAEAPKPRWSSPPVFWSGVAVGSVGVANGVASLVLYERALSAECDSPPGFGPSCGYGEWVASVLLAVPAGVAGLTSISLMIAGAWPATLDAKLAPEVSVGPGAASLRWTF